MFFLEVVGEFIFLFVLVFVFFGKDIPSFEEVEDSIKSLLLSMSKTIES